MEQFRSLRHPQAYMFLIFALVVSLAPSLNAQSSAESTQRADALQTRIERARALIAAHQLETAASELESVRAVANDTVIRNIASLMLVSIYLEAANYGRAEAMLEESFRDRAVQNGESLRTYFALAGQAVNGARTHMGRYRTFGINISDPNLPAEATSDLDRLRSFLERMIAQAKEITNERKVYDSFSLLEDVVGIRLALARDMDDQAKWQSDYNGARQLQASQKQLASLGPISALPPRKSTFSRAPSELPYSTRSSSMSGAQLEEATTPSDQPSSPVEQATSAEIVSAASPSRETIRSSESGPELSDFGLLNGKASKRVFPRYPPLAKQSGTTGLVRVHVVVDETGKVIEVSRSEGPTLLRQAAEAAAKQWFFEGAAGPGQSIRFTGYIDFNFTM